MTVEDAVAGIRTGKPVILPTDTVYGLCANPYREDPVRRLYDLKGRVEDKPMSLLAYDLDLLLECVPELRGRSASVARAVLPGPYTLVFANPARRFRWLTGNRPETIGIRVPQLDGPAEAVLAYVGAVAATSANEPGGPEPRRVEDIPEALRAACSAVLDVGELAGPSSTVIDFTGREPTVLREGAGDAARALALAAEAAPALAAGAQP